MADIKSGFISSEFWATMVVQLIGIAVAFGWIEAKDAPMLGDIITRVIEGVTALIAIVVYIKGRLDLKKIQLQQQQQTSVTATTTPTV